MYDFSDCSLRDLNPACQLLVEFLLMPGSELSEKRGGRVMLVALLRLVTGFGVETLQQNANILIQLIPISERKEEKVKTKNILNSCRMK